MASKSATRHAIYDVIVETACPGDVCFFITEDPHAYNRLSRIQKRYRKWMGFAPEDISVWHVGIISKFEKKPKSSMIRPYFIHSTIDRGVFEQHIPPEYFSSTNIANGEGVCRTVLEIMRCQGISDEQRNQMVDFCRRQIGRAFPRTLYWECVTYLLGLPNIFTSQRKYSCHSLVYTALDQVGVRFPHHLEAAPFTNIGRYLGHPLLLNAKCANPHFPYLRDHHIYQDPRFQCLLTLTLDKCSGEVLSQHNPPKYSWDPGLGAVYHTFAGSAPAVGFTPLH